MGSCSNCSFGNLEIRRSWKRLGILYPSRRIDVKDLVSENISGELDGPGCVKCSKAKLRYSYRYFTGNDISSVHLRSMSNTNHKTVSSLKLRENPSHISIERLICSISTY